MVTAASAAPNTSLEQHITAVADITTAEGHPEQDDRLNHELRELLDDEILPADLSARTSRLMARASEARTGAWASIIRQCEDVTERSRVGPRCAPQP